jgi:small-conductance mechanosensitive channel/CRP-like cAMP-binding protein
MPTWLANLPDIVREDMRSGETIAVAIALLLIALLWVTLPAHHRRVVRQPVIFLGVHLAAHALRKVVFYGDSNMAHFLVVVAVLSILASIGRSTVALVLDVFYGRRLSRPAPKIIRDLVLGIVYMLVALASLRAAGIEPGSILTTSALLTAVIGLSLQETLGNLFAGLALQMQSPFEVGDWIQFGIDQKTVGKVLEVNWRATKVLTLDEVEVVVPNGTLGKAPISNYTKPSPRIRRSIYLTIPLTTPPRKAQRIIETCIKGAWGVLDEPPPSCVTSDFTEAGVQLWLRFWTDQFQKWGIVDGEARDRIWYALAREGIPISSPTREIFVHEVNDEMRTRQRATRMAENLEALQAVDFLAAIPRVELEKLARTTQSHLYAEGEQVVRKGDNADEMYIVRTGEVAVLMPGSNGNGTRKEVARLTAGKFFGEMALMTGEPRTADVIATCDSELLVLGHGAFQATLAVHPELAETISRAIAERQAKLEEHAQSTEKRKERVEQRTSQLLGKIRSFFSL